MDFDAFDVHMEQARRLRADSRVKEALSAYEAARAIDSCRPELCELMEVYVRCGHWSHAVDLGIQIAERALERSNAGRLSAQEAEQIYRQVLSALDGLPARCESSLLDRVYWVLGKIDTLTA